MSSYTIEYRDKDSGQPMCCVLTANRTLAAYEDACRELANEGHTDVRLYVHTASKRLVTKFGKVGE